MENENDTPPTVKLDPIPPFNPDDFALAPIERGERAQLVPEMMETVFSYIGSTPTTVSDIVKASTLSEATVHRYLMALRDDPRVRVRQGRRNRATFWTYQRKPEIP